MIDDWTTNQISMGVDNILVNKIWADFKWGLETIWWLKYSQTLNEGL